MSQPWIVACMAQLLELEGEEKVLEVGTGSGYGAAVLSRLCREVVTIVPQADVSKVQKDSPPRSIRSVSSSAGSGRLTVSLIFVGRLLPDVDTSMGRSAYVMGRPAVLSTTRSITLRSSRTLPGHR